MKWIGFAQAGGVPTTDFIVRTQVVGNTQLTSKPVPTEFFARQFGQANADCTALADAVGVLLKDIEFKDAYIDHLLSGESDDVWEEEQAHRFVREEAELTVDELRCRLSAFRRWLPDWVLSLEEFADFWSVPSERVLQAISWEKSHSNHDSVLSGRYWITSGTSGGSPVYRGAEARITHAKVASEASN